MTSVTFPPALGGDGSTVSDDSNPTTGLKAGGHRTRFVAALEQFVALCASALANATAAAASATTAINAPGTNATSTSNVAIPAVDATLTLTVQSGKAWAVGQWVVATVTSDLAKWAMGQIESYSGTTLVIRVRQINGSGTFNTWAIGLTTPLDATLAGRVLALETNDAAFADSLLFFFGDLG